LSLGYTESAGHPRLRSQISRLHRALTDDEVLVAAPEELIFIAMNALLAPGDHVIALFPGYQSLYEVAQAIGCRVTRWPLRLAGGRWGLDWAALRQSLTPRTRLLVVNFPHNPTGYLPAPEEFMELVAFAQRYGLRLFSDEMYRGLEYDPAARLPAACELYERAVSLSGLSKAYALPGLRIGWLATHDRTWLTGCAAFKDYTTICNSAPSEALAMIALAAGERLLARARAIVAANLPQAETFFAAHPDRFEWLPPLAGSVAFPRYLGPGTVTAWCQAVLAARDVMILPGQVFDFGEEHFRLGLGRLSFPEALAQVAAYVQNHQD
jgi:aspartate/methionine/tyrosine aminotransferase